MLQLSLKDRCVPLYAVTWIISSNVDIMEMNTFRENVL